MQALEDSACAEIHERLFQVTDFLPSSFLRSVSCSIKPISKVEARLNGRTFAHRAFSAFEFRIISADIDGLKDYVERERSADIKESGIEEFMLVWLSAEISSFGEIILFLLNLSYAGIITIENGVTWAGRRAVLTGTKAFSGIYKDEGSLTFLSCGISATPKFDKVLEWSKRCGGIWDGPARTNVEKAVGFLSHTFGSTHQVDDAARMLWATAGLEALACDGGSSVSAQLRRRLPTLCARMSFKDLDRSLRETYNFRSRLFHGDIPVYNAFNRDDTDSSPDRCDYKLSEYGQMLQLILVCAIWECVEQGAISIRFSDDPHFS